MRIPRPTILLLLSAILSPCLADQEAIHWDFENIPVTGAIASVWDKTGKQELFQSDTFAGPAPSAAVPPSPPGPAGNRQAVGFRYEHRQYLQAATSAQLNIGENAAFTLELWANPRSYSEATAATVQPTLIQKRGGAPADALKPGYQLAINSEGKIIFRAEGKDTGGKSLVSNEIVPLGQWTHIAVTRDTSGVFRLYINGHLDLTAGGPRFTGSLENDAEFVIGTNRFVRHPTGSFDGLIDEVRLSPQDLQSESFLIR